MSKSPKIVRAALGLLVLSACITPKEKKDMQNDLFNVQTRLMSLERTITDTSKEAKTSGDTAAKKVASTQSDMERLSRDIQQIRGDIDALKIGVQTGQLPGAPEGGEPSLAARLQELTDRLQNVELSQEELLAALKKAGLKAGGGKKEGKGDGKDKDRALGSAKDLKDAYDAKHYKQVAEEAPNVLKKASAKDKEQVLFLHAESLFKLGKMREAALKYNDFLDGKPEPKLVPLAKMRIGDCFRHLGDGETAKVYYEELIKEFPDSDEAAKAKERLAGGGGGAEKG
jgi:TolA-binding protein